MPVFLVNSHASRLCATMNLRSWSSLLSSVRMQFAEFLIQYYLIALVYSTREPVSVQGTVISHIIFLAQLFVGLSVTHSSVYNYLAIYFRGRFNPQLFNIAMKPFLIRREAVQLLSTLLMLAYSLQLCPDNQTLSFTHAECSSTQLISKIQETNGIVSVNGLRPVNLRRHGPCFFFWFYKKKKLKQQTTKLLHFH